MWTPPATREQLDQREAFSAELVEKMLRHTQGVLEQFNYELRQIDPRLEMIRAQEDTRGTPLKPGYYHIVRWNENAPPSVITVEGEHGEFVEPTGRVFEMLRREDLWNPRNLRERKRMEERARDAEARQKQRDREERQSEIMERYQAGNRAFVSMDGQWTQSARGRRAIQKPDSDA